MKNNLLIIRGGAVKTSEEGVVEGQGIVFTSENDPDQSRFRDYFTPDSFVRKSLEFSVPMYYDHGLGPIKQEIGEAILKKTDSGWNVTGKIYMDDPVAKSIYDVVKSTQHGFSTGALQHLVEREAKSNNTNFLKRWVVGEISLTETPAEPKAVVEYVKSINTDNGEIEFADMWEDDSSKGVSGSTSLPLASRDRTWDAGAATKRVKEWSGSGDKPNAKYKSAFFWWDSSNPDNFTSGKLPFADVVDGTLTAIPKGIFAVAQRLDQTDIPSSDKDGVKRKVASYYSKMREKFSDTNIEVPWKSLETNKEENQVIISIYNEDKEEVWNSESESAIPENGKSIEIKYANGSVMYSIYTYDEKTEMGTQVDVQQWGGAENFFDTMQKLINGARDAMKTESKPDELDFEERVAAIVKKELEGTQSTEAKADENELAELRNQLSDKTESLNASEDALTKAKDRIAQLEILADAKKTLDKYKGKK